VRRPLWREERSVGSEVILASEPSGIYDHILLLQIRDSFYLESHVPQERGGPVVLADTGLSFRPFL
jgi:hypothetical protein